MDGGVSGKTNPWIRLAAGLAIAVGWGMGATAWGAPYEYPSSLRKMDLNLRMENYDSHEKRLSSKNLALKKIDLSTTSGEWHFRTKAGTDMVQSSGTSVSWKPSTALYGGKEVKIRTTIDFPEAEVGDVFLGYYLYKNGKTSWGSGEIALMCGGSGPHANCNKCFKLIPLATAKAKIQSQRSSSGAGPVPARGGQSRMPAENPESSCKVLDLLDMEDLQGRDVELEKDITVYALDRFPQEQAVGRMKTGITLHVAGEAAPAFARVTFAAGPGEEYEGAAKVADLVSVHVFDAEIAPVTVTNQAVKRQEGPADDGWVVGFEEIKHQAFAKVRRIPYDIFHSPGSVRLCCVRQDGTVQKLVYDNWHSHSTDYDFSYSLQSLDGAHSGDEYLCYLLYNGGRKLWVGRPFGVRCGGSGAHAMCGECFTLLPPEETEALLDRIVARKRGEDVPTLPQGASGGGTIRCGKMVLGQDTPVYSLKTWPQEQMMGKLRAGAALYVMEDLGDELVRVRFSVSAGKSREGGVKKSDLGN